MGVDPDFADRPDCDRRTGSRGDRGVSDEYATHLLE
jgi:hypothetical protein